MNTVPVDFMLNGASRGLPAYFCEHYIVVEVIGWLILTKQYGKRVSGDWFF